MNNTNSKKGIVWTVIVIVIIAVAAGVYFKLNKAQMIAKPEEAVTDVSSTTVTNSDWKTYTNSEYGFSINYPSGSTVTEVSDGVTLKVSENNSLYQSASFYVTANTESLTSGCDDMTAAMTPVATSSVSINGMSFVKGDASEPATGMRFSATQYCTLNNGSTYRLKASIEYGRDMATSDGFNPAIDVNGDSVLNRMLSTFTVISTGKDSKTYTNLDYGFKMDIPLDWVTTEGSMANGGAEVSFNTKDAEIRGEMGSPSAKAYEILFLTNHGVLDPTLPTISLGGIPWSVYIDESGPQHLVEYTAKRNNILYSFTISEKDRAYEEKILSTLTFTN